MKILVTPPLRPNQKQKLLAAAPGQEFVFCEKQDITEKELKDADIILGNLADARQLSFCRSLKWIQLNNAGTEGYCEPGVLPRGALLANATGAYGLAIAEHMIGVLFEIRKKLKTYAANQERHQWHSEGFVDVVEGTVVVVIGFGDIGSTFGKKMKGLGCKVYGVKRHVGECPDWADGIFGMEKLDELLGKADIVAMSLPGNDKTRHTLDARRISLLKKGAVVINVGRGTAIDTEALTEALYEGRIAGAGLDVTDPEPLPEDHRLWDAPNAVITPHISGGFALPETLEKIVDLFADNLKRYLDGKEIQNQIEMETGYVRRS